MSGAPVLKRIVDTLESVGIPFMLTGSFAAAYHGLPRSTLDIDFVIHPNESQLSEFVATQLAANCYVSEDAAREAFATESLFNVLDNRTGWKVDLIIRKSRPFSRAEFDRRIPVIFDGTPLSVATIEDVIISKLEWAELGGSARQMEDVTALVKLRYASLDLAYIEKWTAALGINGRWQDVLHTGRRS